VIAPLAVFAFLDGSTAIAHGQDDPLALRVGVQLKITRIFKLTGAVSRGLSNGAEDWGGSAALTVRF
jgi:hypothetical protein